MNEIEKTEMFDDILGMIYSAKQKAEYQVNNTIIELYWTIGEYVSNRIKKDGWGKSTVKALSEYILDVGNGNYMMQGGHHRLKAAKDLGLETMMVDEIISYEDSVKNGITKLPLGQDPEHK
jgi:hypothetical protein